MSVSTTKRWTVTSVVLGSSVILGVIILNGCGTSRAVGVQPDGRLAPCPSSPNCVCSQDTDAKHVVEAIPYTGSLTDAHRRLLTAIGTLPRITVLTDQPNSATTRYLHMTATSLIFRFTDDVEFLIDDTTKRIEIRSLSRLGYSDFGVNRRRVAAIRSAFAQAQ